MSVSFLWSLLVKDPLIIVCTIIMGTISVATSFLDPEGRWTDRIARRWARMLLFLGGVKVHLHGLGHIDRNTNYVFAGNHFSLMDTPVVLPNVPVRFLFLVNAKYVQLPFLGTHLRRSGHFSVDPDDVRGSLRVMTEAARVAKERKLSLLVFPEGARARGPMGEFKEGAAYIAIKAGLPVIPFAIRGTREVLPIGSVHIRGGSVDLAFGEPVSVEGFTLKDRGRLTQVLFDRVTELYSGLTSERSENQPNRGVVHS